MAFPVAFILNVTFQISLIFIKVTRNLEFNYS